jgi:4-hydroxybenzoate polyprenyltransferase
MSGVFDLAPATSHYNLQNQKPALTIILIMGMFGFVLTLLREIVKDMEDIEGDKAIQARSFAIVLGMRTTKLIFLVLALALLASSTGFIYFIFATHRNVAVYLATTVCLPLIYMVLLIYKASGKKDFHKISNMLKLTMLLGMLSVIFI